MDSLKVKTAGEATLIVAMRLTVPAELRLATLIEMDAAFRAEFAEDGIELIEENYIFLALSLSAPGCKCSVKYRRPEDVPLVDVLCEHGNYLLKWEEMGNGCLEDKPA